MITRVAVVVPAADEEAELGGCLTAVDVARMHVHAVSWGRVQVRTVVVLDDCRDRTAEVVAAFPHVRPVTSSGRCVGTARRLGAAHAIETCPDPRELWLANTDADSRVPHDWLTVMLGLAGRGADLVVGTVRPSAGLPATVARTWARAHNLADGHRHVHGANLGISAAAYLAVGGWRDLRAHEDADLVTRAEALRRLCIVRTGAVPVLTSTRREGRAPEGFAAYLHQLERQMEPGLPEVS